MRLLILSDIHSNLDALLSVLKHVKEEAEETYEKIVCLGDLVGYGPNPNEVCEWAINEKKNGGIFVMGNHDESISTDCDISDYNPSAKWAIQIQRRMVSELNKKFLRSLPYKETFETVMFVHGSPSFWSDYIYDEHDAKSNFRYIKGDICFIGHTHGPDIYRDDKGIPKIVNVGSVGQPRDGDARSCYVIFDTVTKEIITNRCKYDVGLVQEKMRKIEMPAHLVDRIEKGK